jgi:hypothetical protein
MVTTHSPRRARYGITAALMMLLALPGTPIAASATHTVGGEGHEPAVDGLALEEASPDQLRALVSELTDQRDELARSLERFDDLYAPLEADRQLLVELRKQVPDTRPEAEAHIERLRSLALSADPSRLGQLADRVADAAPDFLDWRFTEFGSADEATRAYLDSGAGAFDSTMTEFRNEVLLSVANRLDGLLTVLDRVR